ncbi:MAG: hypothetical protein JST92_16070, partial [Deltaproteobacteria bacterium]|nr:hypothetical protein [Deltaproteobacteria bacterium]
MLALAQYQGSSAAQATIARASARLEPGRDPGGELLLRALADNDTARQFALLSASTQEQRLDPLFQWVLGSAAHGSRHEADAEAAFRQVNRMRPDLQAGSDLFNLLSLAGRPDEAKTFARQWAADNPDGEEAQLTWARVAVLEHRAADVDAALERLLLVHGEKLHRLVPICRLSIEVGNLARTRRLAERLLSGDVLEQNMGRYFLGETDVLAGRLNQARESFQTAYDLGHTQGTAGNAVQALEEQRSIAEVLGDQEALQRVDTLRIEQFTRLGLREMVAYATFERALAQRGSGPCPQIAPVLESLSTGPVHVMLEMLLVRAAAVAGCRPCADAVRLGQGSAELEQRSLFHLAQCAEQTGDLALAERTYARVTWVGAGSGTYGATAHGVLALWRRSRLLAKLGRADESLALAREFLQRWSQTDRPVPGVDEARAALRSR